MDSSEADLDNDARRQDVGHVAGDVIAVVGPEMPLLSGTFPGIAPGTEIPSVIVAATFS